MMLTPRPAVVASPPSDSSQSPTPLASTSSNTPAEYPFPLQNAAPATSPAPAPAFTVSPDECDYVAIPTTLVKAKIQAGQSAARVATLRSLIEGQGRSARRSPGDDA